MIKNKIALNGASGRMGQAIAQLALQSDKYDIVSMNDANVVVDFSNPSTIDNLIKTCIAGKIPIVIGTTGYNESQLQLIKQGSSQIPIFKSSNMSISVAVLSQLVQVAAKQLDDFEVSILDIHHKHKKDAPSGTALHIGHLIADVKGIDFKQHAVFNDNTACKNDIKFISERRGEEIGKHTVTFELNGEIIELVSMIQNRTPFAHGALLAADFIIDKPPGLYDMTHLYPMD